MNTSENILPKNKVNFMWSHLIMNNILKTLLLKEIIQLAYVIICTRHFF